MSIKLSREQRELQGSLRQFFGKEVSSSYLRSRLQSGQSIDQNLWRKIRDLGLIEYFAAEEGDFKPSCKDLSVISFESGYALLPEPLVETILAGPYLIFQVLSPQEREALEAKLGNTAIEEIACGQKRVCLAASTPLYQPALMIDDKGVISGKIRFLNAVDSCDWIVIVTDKPKRALHVVDLKKQASGQLSMSRERLLDLTLQGFELSLQNVSSVSVDNFDQDRIRSLLYTLKAAEVAGICARAVEMTTEYVKTRKQFDVPVGGFQAVQHRLADMLLQSEAIRAITNFAAWAVEASAEQSAMAAHAAISYACDVGPSIVESAIQLHGGIGFTWEYDLHFYLRRMRGIEALYRSDEKEYDLLLKLAGEMR